MEGDGAIRTTTCYVGGIYETQGITRTSYYYVAGQRIAMRVGAPGTAGTLTYLHGDHPRPYGSCWTLRVSHTTRGTWARLPETTSQLIVPRQSARG